MKKVIWAIGVLLLIALVAAGSFWAGIAYQTNRVAQVEANFLNARGQAGGGQFPRIGQDNFEGGAPQDQAGRFFRLGGTMGQIKVIDGNTLTVSTSQDVTTVNLTNSTCIEKTVQGTNGDLQPGMRVMVTGERDSEGVITADQISILNIDPSLMPYPPPSGGTP